MQAKDGDMKCGAKRDVKADDLHIPYMHTRPHRSDDGRGITNDLHRRVVQLMDMIMKRTGRMLEMNSRMEMMWEQ